MTSATGDSPFGMLRVVPGPAREGRGFTLVEILLVLALLGLMAGAALLATSSLLHHGVDDGREAAWDVIQDVRSQAILSGVTGSLRVGEHGKSLIVRLPGAETVRTLPAGVTAEIHPEAATDETGRAGKPGTRAVVRFYRDGTCDAFQLRLTSDRNAAAIILSVDPWTGAPALALPGA